MQQIWLQRSRVQEEFQGHVMSIQEVLDDVLVPERSILNSIASSDSFADLAARILGLRYQLVVKWGTEWAKKATNIWFPCIRGKCKKWGTLHTALVTTLIDPMIDEMINVTTSTALMREQLQLDIAALDQPCRRQRELESQLSKLKAGQMGTTSKMGGARPRRKRRGRRTRARRRPRRRGASRRDRARMKRTRHRHS